jgi:Zn-dependent protease with chaperone function
MTTSVPDRSRVRLPGISSRAYEHPADRSALVALRKLTGFDTILKNVAGLFNDRALRLMFLASSVRASEQQFPDLYQMMMDGCYILDLPNVPELYISQNFEANAMALGMDKPFIVLNSAIVELMDAEELRFVIGHELGHVLSGHAVYNTMLRNLILLVQRLALFPLAWFGLRAVVWGLEEWHRKAEMSSDRAGLLATQDVDAARRALMKLAGGRRLAEFSSDEFHRQAREYDAVPDVRDSLLKLLQLQGQTHPFAVVRFAELDRWAEDGEYENILAGNYPRREDDPSASVGDEFKNAAKSYQDSWNRSADPLVGAVRGVANSGVDAASRLFNRFAGGSSGRQDDDDNNDSN